MAGGKLKAMCGMSRTEYLRAFRRADLLPEYPGPTFPLSRARPLAPILAQELSPLPLVLLGRGVADAFRFPSKEVCSWEDYLLDHVLIRAAVIPHPSGRNLSFTKEMRQQVGAWLREQVELHRPK